MKKRTMILLLILNATIACGQQYMIVFLNKKQNPELPKEQVDKLMEGHMGNMARLHKENKLKAAGPFDGGGGIFIFLTNSKKQVEEWISTDPGIQAKRWDIEIFPFKPVTGSICDVGEKYQMISYTFVRYGLNQSKDTFSDLSQSVKEHNDYIKQLVATGSVVTEASIGEDEGNILIMKGDITNEVINQDPSIQKQIISADIKKLYIAKGSFCER